MEMTPMSIAKGDRPFDFVLLLLLGLSVSVNLWQWTRPPAVAGAAEPPTIAVGADAPPIKGKTLDGRLVSLTAPTGGALALYIYSPECVWCTRNTPNISALASGRRSGTRLVGVCLGTVATCQAPAVGFDDTIIPEPETHAGYKLGSTPQTIVVVDSRVDRVWTGAYSPRISGEIESYFGAKLPGLEPNAAPTKPS
jgi:hypothetical protein